MRLLWGYGAWVVAIVAAYLAVPALHGPGVSVMGLTVFGVIAARVAACRPARKLPWLLMAAAALCFTGSGITIWLGGDDTAHVPSIRVVDVLGFLVYPLLASALGLFARSRGVRGDRRDIVDAVTVTAGLAVLLGLFRTLPAWLNPALTGQQEAIVTADSVGQVALLLALALLLSRNSVRHWLDWPLAYGTACGLIGSVVFGLLRSHQVHLEVFYGSWMAGFALYGAAAVHPAMRELTEQARHRPYRASRTRVIILTGASLVAPALLIYQGRNNSREVAIALSAVLLLLIAQAQLWSVNISHLRSLASERALRAVGPALASASSMEEIAAAVRSAAVTGYGHRPEHGALFARRDDGELHFEVTMSNGRRAARFMEKAPDWLPAALPLLAGHHEPLYIPAADLHAAGADAAGEEIDGVLLCPVILTACPPDGNPISGVVGLIGEHWSLLDRWSALQILTSEVGLAMERVLLTHELVKRESQEVFRELVQNASDAILIFDEDYTVRYATPSAADIFGDIPIEGADLRQLAAARDREQDPDGLVGSGGPLREFSELWKIKRHDGQTVRARARLTDLRANPSVQGRVLTLRNITEQRRLRDELRHRALHDALTGLPNRFLFADRATHALSLARQTGTVTAVFFMDLDDFKEVNDTLGHGVGDELLAAFGQRLAEVARESDTVARVGGDEFALLIENLADVAQVDEVAARTVAAFSVPFTLSERSVITTATVGVATSNDSADVDELMRYADLALYAARSVGKRRWQRYTPALSDGMHQRLEIRLALEKAVLESAFVLAYQPIVTLRTGQIAGFESLVRWPHPERGLLMPGYFIDIAEDTGLIVPLGAWVLRRALSDLAAEREPGQGGPVPYVAVNVSARQLRVGGFVNVVREALDTTGLSPSALLLELTESALVRLEGSVGADLAELKRLGVRLAIDDFGTGYSSLSYLRELPIDVLKIDKSFVDDIAVSSQRLALVRGIVQIAKTLDIAVVAEGIETSEQCELLTEMGCDYGQGYLMAKPMKWADADCLLRSGHPLIPARRTGTRAAAT